MASSESFDMRETFSLRNNPIDEALTELTSSASWLMEQAVDQQAELIASELGRNQRLMEDHAQGEKLRRETLRSLPQTKLSMKLRVVRKLSASVTLRTKRRRHPLSCWKLLQYKLGFALTRAKDRFRDFIYTVELCSEDIRKIEGKLGSSVGAYFYTLRWLFLCNFTLLVLMMTFIVGPQMVHDTRVGTKPLVYSEQYIVAILDLISGKGPYKNSTLFYGRYHSGVVAGSGYSMPFAYFYTMLGVYLTFLGVMCYKTALSYRKNFIETEGGVRHVFANKVFSGWDYSIASPGTATINCKIIYNELKELLAEQERDKIPVPIYTRLWNMTVNAVIWAIVIVVILAFQHELCLLYFESQSDMPIVKGLQYPELIVSLFVTVVVSIAPVVFGLIAKLEFYQPRTKLYVTLIRTCLIYTSPLILLLGFHYRRTVRHKCWETAFGQEIYRLVILDGTVSLVLYPVLEFTKGLIYRLKPTLTYPEFSISYNAMTLLYNQALLWYGTMFSPLLVAAVVVKFLLLFYVKRACAMHACVPARRIWRAAQTQTVMYVLVTVSMFVTLFIIGSLVLKSSSRTCGPFKDYPAVYTVLTEATLELSSHSVVQTIISLLLRPVVIAIFMLLLGSLVYYMHGCAQAHNAMVEILREMLVSKAKDKDFLRNAIEKVSSGEWQYRPRDEDPSALNSQMYDEIMKKPSNAGFYFDTSRLYQSELDTPRPNQSVSNTSCCNQSGPDTTEEKSVPYSYEYEGLNSKNDDTESSFSWTWSNIDVNQSNISNIEDGRNN